MKCGNCELYYQGTEEEKEGAVKRKGRKQTKIEAGVGVSIHKKFSKNVVKIYQKK